ncbi:MAG: polysaccharide biosynthesis/export family protein [Phycisphaeraceae bacterium]|nr:polysaccharide biosynthesis/export family protein [Phycisphaeraceae bacterium]
MESRVCAMVMALAMVVALAGCRVPPPGVDFDVFLDPDRPRAIVAGKPYVIEPPDSIRVLAPEASEDLHNVTATIRPDGYITLPLIGEMMAAGKTPSQLAAEIEEAALRYYDRITVQVEMTSFVSKRYYMAGETSAGPKQYTGRDTVLDAALSAGIPRSAWPERAVLIRPSEQPDLIARMTVNLRDLYELGDHRYNVVLEEGDILFIPTNRVAQVGIFVQNLISPVDPVIRAISTPARASAGLP